MLYQKKENEDKKKEAKNQMSGALIRGALCNFLK